MTTSPNSRKRASTKKPDAKSAAAKSAKPKRRVIMVLGMHRSGTSALTRALNLMGADLPATLIEKDSGNPRGYWESRKIARLNDAILESAGTAWFEWQAFPEGWFSSPAIDGFIDQAKALLIEEFAESSLFLFKDPRVCLLLPFWRRVLAEMDIEPLVIQTIRHPMEVADSLNKRNNQHHVRALSLWLRYNLAAEHGSRGLSRVFTTYEALLDDPRFLPDLLEEKLKLTLPRQSQSAEKEVMASVVPGDRHHAYSLRDLSSAQFGQSWLEQTYNILGKWCTTGEQKKDHKALDQVSHEFDSATGTFGSLITELEKISDLSRKHQESAASSQTQLEARDRELRAKDQELETDRTRLREERDVARAERDAARNALQRVESDVLSSSEKLAALDANFQEHLAHSNESLKAAESEISEKSRTIADLEKRLDQNKTEAKQTADDLVVARKAIRNRTQTVEDLEARLQAQASQAHSASNELDASKAEAERQNQAIAQLERDLQDQSKKTEKANFALSAARHEAAEQTATVAELEDRLAQQAGSAVDLETQLRDTVDKHKSRAKKFASKASKTEKKLKKANETVETLQQDRTAHLQAIEEMELLAQQQKESITTLEGNFWESRVLAERYKSDAISGEEERKSHKRQLASLRTDWEDKQTELTKLKTDVTAKNQELSYLRGEAGRRGDRLRVLEKALEEKKKESYDARQAISRFEQEVAEQQDALSTAANKLSHTQSELLQRRHEAEETARALTLAREKLDEYAKSRDEMAEELDAAKSALSAQSETAENSAQELAKLQNELDILQQDAAATAHALLAANALIQEHESALDEQRSEHKNVVDELARAKEALNRQGTDTAATEQETNDLRAAFDALSEQHTQAAAEVEALQNEVTTRFNEITAVTDMLRRTETEKAAFAAQLDALQNQIGSIMDVPEQIKILLSVLFEQTRRPYLPQRTVLSRQLTLLRATGILDEEWYLETYPDIVGTGLTAGSHFVKFGNQEGRVPNEKIAKLPKSQG